MQTNVTAVHLTKDRSDFRTRTASTKVTDAEFRELERFATEQGQSISEWIRQTLLTEARSRGGSAMNVHIFTELVGVQMLLMNTLEPLLRGDKLAQDQLTILFRQVQATKAAKAQELLAKRTQTREK